MVTLTVEAGRLTTLQDEGRVGHARVGVPRSGPMDMLHHRLAGRLLGPASPPPELAGNTPDSSSLRQPSATRATVAIEVGPDGATFQAADGAILVSVAGPSVSVDGEVAATTALVRRLIPGTALHVQPVGSQWAYVAVAGDLTVAPLLGSVSQHPRSGLGGSLPSGTVLASPGVWEIPVRPWAGAEAHRTGSRVGPLTPSAPDPALFGVLPAPQTHLFTSEARAGFTAAAYRTTSRFDRMGQLLDGPSVQPVGGHDIVSDGVIAGTIQVPGEGPPFVLTADHQTTGGYPKLAVLCRADLARFVQLPVGTPLRFEWIDVAEAEQRWAGAISSLERMLARHVRPDAAALASRNLIGGVPDA